MKKIAIAMALTLALGATASAAPINQLGEHETEIQVGTRDASIEHKITNKVTLGVDRSDRDEYGNNKSAYLQYDLIGSNLKLIGGYRWDMIDETGDHNNLYGGFAVSTPRIFGFDGYASYTAGRDYNETQVGINKDILLNVGLNVNYHNYKPDSGHHEDGVGVGVNFRF